MPSGPEATYFFPLRSGLAVFDSVKREGLDLSIEFVQALQRWRSAFCRVERWTRDGVLHALVHTGGQLVGNGVALLGDSAHIFILYVRTRSEPCLGGRLALAETIDSAGGGDFSHGILARIRKGAKSARRK